MNTFDKLAWQRANRMKNNNAHTKRYEKTQQGFLMRTYRNMQSRVLGIQYLKAHLYQGKEILNREEFYSWASSDATFQGLFDCWQASEYAQRLTPSINRKNTQGGYTMENIEWITHSENSRLGVLARWHRAT